MPSTPRLAQQLCDRFQDTVSEPLKFRGETTLRLKDAARIAEVLDFARRSLGFDLLLDVSAVDHMGREPRFEIVYHLHARAAREYLRVKTSVGEEAPELPSVASIWRAANWLEREVYDMSGIRFTGHPDLRRILMWDTYPHHPLRKEFPLAGLPTEDGRAKPAPLDGGPFVTSPGDRITRDREPRGKGETDRVV